MSAFFCGRNWQMFWGACLGLVNECILIPLKLPAASLLPLGCSNGKMVRHQDDPVTQSGGVQEMSTPWLETCSRLCQQGKLRHLTGGVGVLMKSSSAKAFKNLLVPLMRLIIDVMTAERNTHFPCFFSSLLSMDPRDSLP